MALGAAIGDELAIGDVVSLIGPLGAGKSTLARAAIQRRVKAVNVPSPTFTLVETYDGEDLSIWHFDFYRLEKPADAWELGIEDALEEGASLIEWPERGPKLPQDRLMTIRFVQGDSGRRTEIIAAPSWCGRLEAIASRIENQRRD